MRQKQVYAVGSMLLLLLALHTNAQDICANRKENPLAIAMLNDSGKVFFYIAIKENENEEFEKMLYGNDHVLYKNEGMGYYRILSEKKRYRELLNNPLVMAIEASPYKEKKPSGEEASIQPSNDLLPDEETSINKSITDSLKTYPYKEGCSIPLKDMQIDRLENIDPRFDGRGVIYADMESMPNLMLPEMKWAYDRKGDRIPKIHTMIPIISNDIPLFFRKMLISTHEISSITRFPIRTLLSYRHLMVKVISVTLRNRNYSPMIRSIKWVYHPKDMFCGTGILIM
jgi:hypothetical protein